MLSEFEEQCLADFANGYECWINDCIESNWQEFFRKLTSECSYKLVADIIGVDAEMLMNWAVIGQIPETEDLMRLQIVCDKHGLDNPCKYEYDEYIKSSKCYNMDTEALFDLWAQDFHEPWKSLLKKINKQGKINGIEQYSRKFDFLRSELGENVKEQGLQHWITTGAQPLEAKSRNTMLRLCDQYAITYQPNKIPFRQTAPSEPKQIGRPSEAKFIEPFGLLIAHFGSIRRFAIYVGVSELTASKWARGQSKPAGKNLQKLIKLCGVLEFDSSTLSKSSVGTQGDAIALADSDGNLKDELEALQGKYGEQLTRATELEARLKKLEDLLDETGALAKYLEKQEKRLKIIEEDRVQF